MDPNLSRCPARELISMVVNRPLVELSDRAQHDPQALDAAMRKVLETISYRERKILEMRIRYGDEYDYSLKEIAGIFKMSKGDVLKIQVRAIRKMRQQNRLRHLKPFIPDGIQAPAS